MCSPSWPHRSYLTADELLAVELAGKGDEGRLDDTTAETEHQVERGLLLDVVVRQRAPVLELLPGEDETLLVRGDALLVLDLGLHVVNRVRRLHLEGDGLARQGLDEDLRGWRRGRTGCWGGGGTWRSLHVRACLYHFHASMMMKYHA